MNRVEKGRWTFYKINDSTIDEVLEALNRADQNNEAVVYMNQGAGCFQIITRKERSLQKTIGERL